MNSMKIAAAAALGLAAGIAGAKPTDLGTGPSTYSFSGSKDGSFYVELGPGTYSFSSEVDATGQLDLASVWFSFAKDKNANGKNDLGSFTSVGQDFTGNLTTLTLTQTRNVYVNVDTVLGKKGSDVFNGTLTVSAVPEPTSTALLMAGIGMLGFMSRRRNNKNKG